MKDRLDHLLAKMRELERELSDEIEKKEKEFFYEVRGRRVRFTEVARRRHRGLAKKLLRTLLDSRALVLLTTPIIWACLIPFVLLDLFVSLYQSVCFPIYGIPKVQRRGYLVIDRHHLAYLNLIEKVNCVYCGYANGLLAYVTEVAGRTEQFWCPIKHASRLRAMHSRYGWFFDYGDAESYRRKVEEVRRGFDDLR